MAVNITVDVDLEGNDLGNINSVTTNSVFFGTMSSAPSDSEYASDEVALYFKDDENLYKKPNGGSEVQIGGGSSAGFSEEEVEDIVDGLLLSGDNITLNYDDPNDELTINASDTNLSNQEVEDIVNDALVGGSSIDITYDDANGEILIEASGSSTDTRTDVSDAGTTVVQDTSDINFTSSGAAGVSVSDDGDGSATVDVDANDTNLTDDEVEDIVANLLNGGSDIDTTYSDSTGTLTIDYTGSSSGGSSELSTVPMRSELDNGSRLEQGIPVPNGESIEITGWGAITSEDTTPSGLSVELVDQDETVVHSQNTSYTEGSPVVSDTNSTGTLSWYKLAVTNSTGTDFIDGNTPDSVYGYFTYRVN